MARAVKTAWKCVLSVMSNAVIVLPLNSAQTVEFVYIVPVVSGAKIAIIVARATSFASDAEAVPIVPISAQNVICIAVTAPISVIPVDFVNTAALKIVSVKTECALKTLIMKTTSALIADSASA